MESKEIAVVEENKLIEYLDVMGLAQKLNDKEKKSFLEIAKAYKLNPFKREIYCSKYGDNLSIITGYEVYIKRAERTGMLDGWGVETEGNVDDNTLKAVITIHRKDWKHPFVHEAYYSEYVQLKDEYKEDSGKSVKTGKKVPNKFWEKAQTMTKKVATSQGFRLCFSDELGGMPYTKEEMPDPEEANAVVIESKLMEPPKKPEISAESFANALATISAAKKDWDKVYPFVANKYALTEDQDKQLSSVHNTISETLKK